MSMTSLFLASKVEETPVRLRDLFACFDRLLKRRAGLDCSPLSDQRHQAWTEALKEAEVILLNKVGFEVYVDVPHKFILHFINYLHPTAREEDSAISDMWHLLNQRCWNTLNDCLLSSRVLFQYTPSVIACTAIYLAANTLELVLPHEWWQLFDVPNDTLYACAVDIQRLYKLLAGDGTGSAPLDYIPTDPTDNAQTNELIVYPIRNRAKLLEERKRQIEAQQAATQTTDLTKHTQPSQTMEM